MEASSVKVGVSLKSIPLRSFIMRYIILLIVISAHASSSHGGADINIMYIVSGLLVGTGSSFCDKHILSRSSCPLRCYLGIVRIHYALN